MSSRKNILFILTDQQSANMMSCSGNPWLQTPALDSIARRGTRFDLAFCTNPVCIPSRFSLFTGRYPTEIGMRSNAWSGKSLPDHIRKNGLGHIVRSAGYETVYGGKEHLPGTNAEKLGFDYFCRDEREGLAHRCADYLKQDHDRPFFLVASFINPHDICYLAISEFADSKGDQKLMENSKREMETLLAENRLPEGMAEEDFFSNVCPPLPENHEPQQDEPEAVGDYLNQREFKRKARDLWGEKEWRRHRWVYARLTERVDRQIGIVLEALRESGLEKNTIVIFTSDHGDHDAAHKMEHKMALYEEATRIPLLIADPDSPHRNVVDETHLVCNGTDLFATICDYAGAEMPADLEGSSLKPLLRGRKMDNWRETLLTEGAFATGIRTASLSYVLCDRGKNREQLYDLRLDPGQTRNFAELPEYNGELQRLRSLALEAQARTAT